MIVISCSILYLKTVKREENNIDTLNYREGRGGFGGGRGEQADVSREEAQVGIGIEDDGGGEQV